MFVDGTKARIQMRIRGRRGHRGGRYWTVEYE
jgi:hypothetical protein